MSLLVLFVLKNCTYAFDFWCQSLQKDLMASISALNHFLEVSAFAPANVIMMAELVVLPHINHDDRAGGAT